MVGKSLAKRYGANGGRGRIGQTGHEKRKGDGVAGTGWERCFAATEMERKRCYVSSGTQELMSGAAGCRGFKGCACRAVARVWHPAQAGAVLK